MLLSDSFLLAQLERNTQALLQSESHLRRQSHLLGLTNADHHEEHMRHLHNHRAERWLSLAFMCRAANKFAENLALLRYMEEHQNDVVEEVGEPGSPERKAHRMYWVVQFKYASRVLTRAAQRFAVKLDEQKKMRACARLGFILRAKVSERAATRKVLLLLLPVFVGLVQRNGAPVFCWARAAFSHAIAHSLLRSLAGARVQGHVQGQAGTFNTPLPPPPPR